MTSRSDYNVKHINAAPGNPSTFWQRKDAENKDRWFRKRIDADNKINGVYPSDYELKKTFWKKNKDLIMSVGIVLAVAAVVWYLTNPRQFRSVSGRLKIGD
jgi:hypothetical protein